MKTLDVSASIAVSFVSVSSVLFFLQRFLCLEIGNFECSSILKMAAPEEQIRLSASAVPPKIASALVQERFVW